MNEELDDIYSVQTPGTNVWVDKLTWVNLKDKARLMTDHRVQTFVEVVSINGTEHGFFLDYATVFAHTTKAQREEIQGLMGTYIEEVPHKKEWET